MKYIITENKIDKVIYNYIVNLFENNDLGELNFTYYEDEYGNEIADAMQFYFGDYGDDLHAFRWYDVGYYDGGCDNCPIVVIESELENELNGLFSDKWYEQFKEYLKKYYGLKVKSLQ